MRKNFITAWEAHEIGLHEIHFTFTGIGDQILLLAAAEQYYKKTGQKLLLACQYHDFLHKTEYCHILSGIDSETIEKLYVSQCKTKKKYTSSIVVINGVAFTLKFISPYNFSMNKDGLFIRRWPGNHILARLCERLGLSGEIEIAPEIRLGQEHQESDDPTGKAQIAIMAGGRTQYKHFPPKIAQKIVDALHKEYHFIQVGGNGDPPLTNVRNVTGKLSLRETAVVLQNSSLFVGSIGGLMHLARSVKCPSIIAISGEPLHCVRYTLNEYVFSDTPCFECPESQRDPFHDPCPFAYRCSVNISPEKMVDAIVKKFSTSACYPKQAAILTPAPVTGMELWHRNRLLVAQRLGKKIACSH